MKVIDRTESGKMPQYHFTAQHLLYPFIKGIEDVFISNQGSHKTCKIHLTDWVYPWPKVPCCSAGQILYDHCPYGSSPPQHKDLHPNSKVSRYPNTGILLFVFLVKIPLLTLPTQTSALVAYLLWTAKKWTKTIQPILFKQMNCMILSSKITE